jgi:hypothetical protein
MAWCILDWFAWLAAYCVELLQAILFIAVQMSAAVFLVTCFKYCSRDIPTAIFSGYTWKAVSQSEDWGIGTRWTGLTLCRR